MIAILFEFTVKDGQESAYFDLATALKSRLDQVDGFLSIERFKSVSTEGKFVSISFWRDEAAVAAWRADTRHRAAQDKGKAEIFSQFRLRTVEVLREIRFDEGRREVLDYRAG
jgi:heme-degrading monooxygenase HmoA